MISQGNNEIFWVLNHISAPWPCHSVSNPPDCEHGTGCTQLVLTADKGQLKPAGCVFTGLLTGVIKKLFFQKQVSLCINNRKSDRPPNTVRLKDFKGE